MKTLEYYQKRQKRNQEHQNEIVEKVGQIENMKKSHSAQPLHKWYKLKILLVNCDND